MNSQQFLVNDSSTVANFKSWASALSNFVRTAGWTNTADTGQLNGAGGGTWSGVTTVPGSGAFYYEIFQPGDGLTNFYLKLEYGNGSGSTNSPTVRVTLGTGTNGAGTLTGFVTTATVAAPASYGPPSTTTTYECDFSGDSGRLSILLWRNAGTGAQIFAVQRSLNASGTPTGTYATVLTAGFTNNTGTPGQTGYMQTLYFAIGPCTPFLNRFQSGSFSGWPARYLAWPGSSAFNGQIPVDFICPAVGVWDYPCTVIGVAYAGDLVEGVSFTVTNQYGQTKTYMPTKSGNITWAAGAPGQGVCVCVEYD
jgi:hypothetical protein